MRIALIPGDGIGRDVAAEVVKILGAVTDAFAREVEIEPLPYGADHFLTTGITFPADGYADLRATSTPSFWVRSAIRACPTTATPATSCSACGSRSTCM